MDFLTYDEVLKQNKNCTLTLLLGNGFSMSYDSKRFSFTSLLDSAIKQGIIKENSKINKLFKKFDTYDFEKVIRVMEDFIKANEIFFPSTNNSEIKTDIKSLKEYLVAIITNNHPDKSTKLTEIEYTNAINFITKYNRIYTLNYDLLLYWTTMKLMELKNQYPDNCLNITDGFSEQEDGATYLKFVNAGGNSFGIHYLHGGLHLYDKGDSIVKITYSRTEKPLKDQILYNLNQEVYPVFISEGTSKQKKDKIIHNPYLNTCYRSFKQIGGNLVIFGTALKKNDEHIKDAIINGNIENVYIGISSQNKAKDFDSFSEKFCKRKIIKGKDKLKISRKVYFFDYNTVDVWGKNKK